MPCHAAVHWPPRCDRAPWCRAAPLVLCPWRRVVVRRSWEGFGAPKRDLVACWCCAVPCRWCRAVPWLFVGAAKCSDCSLVPWHAAPLVRFRWRVATICRTAFWALKRYLIAGWCRADGAVPRRAVVHRGRQNVVRLALLLCRTTLLVPRRPVPRWKGRQTVMGLLPGAVPCHAAGTVLLVLCHAMPWCIGWERVAPCRALPWFAGDCLPA